jgi:mono/diheme cytochrome c family protein
VVYHAGSCLACHRPPEGSGRDAGLPSGGTPFPTPVGTFYPQNLTPDPETGIGRWSEIDFVNAMRLGLSPRGTHYFPAFPYASYRSMTMADLLDLRAYLMSLTPVEAPAREAEVPVVAVARRGVGLWKRVAFRQPTWSPEPGRPPSWTRGAYLANGPGHCGECHTPKDRLMVADESRHLAGGPHPGGEGQVPSLRGLLARKKYAGVDDLVLALQNGETLGYEDLSSGGMARIQENLARLPESDLRAISEYLLSLE